MSDRPRAEFWRWPVILPACTLALAVGLQGLTIFSEKPQARAAHLAQAVPLDLPGWSAQELPLGPSEFLAGEAGKVLNFDEVLYREYDRAGEKFQVYVAYWGAGKMPTRMVASHTPDRCWTENGWQCQEMKFKQTGIFPGVSLQPAEWRIFQPPRGNQPTYVVYWHLVEGHIYDYGDRFNQVPSPMLWIKDAVQQAFLGSREQYFIRLTSNQPLENLGGDPGFAAVLHGLGSLGLTSHPAPLARL
jgi:hypothetical protein